MLAKLLDEDGIVDGGIQGEAIRLVTTPGREARFAASGDAKVGPAEPALRRRLCGHAGWRAGRTLQARGGSGFLVARREGPVIEAEGLVKRFGDFTAADNITFDIPSGEIFGLLGPNGAGKSTTFKMLCGLLKPTGGEGRVAGFDLRRDAAQARNRLGYMAQKFSLYGDLSVRQNLQFFAGFTVSQVARSVSASS